MTIREYETRVEALEIQGICTSDAQAIVDAEMLQPKHSAILNLAEYELSLADKFADDLAAAHGTNPMRWAKADRDRLAAMNKRSARYFREARCLELID
jgi:hypothetical protein